MDIRQITPDYAVSPQIEPEDVAVLKEQGFTTVVNNRPDMENPVELQAEVLRAAVEAAGMTFVDNPVIGTAMTMENVQTQAANMPEGSDGKVMAYCASGTRSAVMWALASAGKMATDDILKAVADAGYPLEGLRGQIDALAAQG